MALALVAADYDGIYIATDSGGAEPEKHGPQGSLVRPLGARFALALGRSIHLDTCDVGGVAIFGPETIGEAAAAVRDQMGRTCNQAGDHVPALVCGFDVGGQPHCLAIDSDQPCSDPKLHSRTRLPSMAVRAVGAFRAEALQRVHEGLNDRLPIARALRCGINRALALEDAQPLAPFERALCLPALVFHFRPDGRMVRVL